MLEEPFHKKGVSSKGKDYDMRVQSAVVSVGNKVVRVEFASFDPEEELPVLTLGSVIQVNIEESYMQSRQLVVKGSLIA